jgi:hypothetical protein
MISFSVHKLSAYGLVHKDSKTAACQFWVLLQNKRQNHDLLNSRDAWLSPACSFEQNTIMHL